MVRKAAPARPAKKAKRASVAKKPGTLIIIGGHEDKEGACVILAEVAKRLNGKKLIVSTVASSEPEGYFASYQQAFKKLGNENLVEVYVADRHETTDEEKLAVFTDAAGIFFTGGDQLRISSQIGDTPFETLIRKIFAKGGIIAGTSAGASVMGETMLIRGNNAESYKIGDLHLAPGLGFLPNVIIDQHFAERGRISRLLGAIALNPRILGIGIDEDTAIVVQGTEFYVIGKGAVYIVDGADLTHSNVAEADVEAVLSVYDVKIHVLSAGDHFDIITRRPVSFLKR